MRQLLLLALVAAMAGLCSLWCFTQLKFKLEILYNLPIDILCSRLYCMVFVGSGRCRAWFRSWQYCMCQLGIPIPGSRPIFSIPNPGIGDALIPGFRDYEKWAKCPNFTWYLREKYFFPEFWGQFRALKLRMRGFDPNTHRFTGAIVLNKPFMCLRRPTLLYSISLDA